MENTTVDLYAIDWSDIVLPEDWSLALERHFYSYEGEDYSYYYWAARKYDRNLKVDIQLQFDLDSDMKFHLMGGSFPKVEPIGEVVDEVFNVSYCDTLKESIENAVRKIEDVYSSMR